MSSSLVAACAGTAHAQTVVDPILDALIGNRYNLEDDGRAFLLSEAHKSDYFLLGELHGDSQIPKLLHALWPEMWKDGYRHVAAEVSPWTANQLEGAPVSGGFRIEGLWTRHQSDDLHRVAGVETRILWGCDMEEMHPEFLIRELAGLNPGDNDLRKMVEATKDGYQRSMAQGLLALAKASKSSKDDMVNDISLRKNLLATLQIDKDRANAASRMTAQNEREFLMKTQFVEHLRAGFDAESHSKVLLRFGRNHLHRGYDARGISTLGNFIAEFGVSRGQTVFNVGAFGAGGEAFQMGETFSADERQDELAFALLAKEARYAETIFDLRPLRPLLHAIPMEKRTALENNLTYWADAYDSLICYKLVTPLRD